MKNMVDAEHEISKGMVFDISKFDEITGEAAVFTRFSRDIKPNIIEEITSETFHELRTFTRLQANIKRDILAPLWEDVQLNSYQAVAKGYLPKKHRLLKQHFFAIYLSIKNLYETVDFKIGNKTESRVPILSDLFLKILDFKLLLALHNFADTGVLSKPMMHYIMELDVDHFALSQEVEFSHIWHPNRLIKDETIDRCFAAIDKFPALTYGVEEQKQAYEVKRIELHREMNAQAFKRIDLENDKAALEKDRELFAKEKASFVQEKVAFEHEKAVFLSQNESIRIEINLFNDHNRRDERIQELEQEVDALKSARCLPKLQYGRWFCRKKLKDDPAHSPSHFFS